MHLHLLHQIKKEENRKGFFPLPVEGSFSSAWVGKSPEQRANEAASHIPAQPPLNLLELGFSCLDFPSRDIVNSHKFLLADGSLEGRERLCLKDAHGSQVCFSFSSRARGRHTEALLRTFTQGLCPASPECGKLPPAVSLGRLGHIFGAEVTSVSEWPPPTAEQGGGPPDWPFGPNTTGHPLLRVSHWAGGGGSELCGLLLPPLPHPASPLLSWTLLLGYYFKPGSI